MWRSLEHVDDAERFGGKAANLGALLRAGVPVPSGWALEDEALRQVWRQNGLEHWVEAQRVDDAWSVEGLERLSAQVERRLMGASLPVRLEAWLETLGAESTMWIVRSSGVGEDGQQASFAGQLTSVLNVRGGAALKDAVRRCWASAWSVAALSYQAMRGVSLRGVGVVIQPMIEPLWAGVFFTQAPDRVDGALIEYVRGHAEALVQGEVTPQRVAWQVGQVPEWGELPGGYGRQLLELGERACALFEGPQDLEWVVAQDERVYLVQARPITVGVKRDEDRRLEGLARGGRELVWSNANMVENYPDPICPLLYSVARRGYTHYFRSLGVAFGVSEGRIKAVEGPLGQIVGVHRGHLYYTLSHVHECLRAAPFGDWLSASWDGFIGVEQGVEDRPALMMASAVELVRMVGRVAQQLATLESQVSRFEARVDAFAAAVPVDGLSERRMDELVGAVRAFMEVREHGWVEASLADAATTMALALLRAVVARGGFDEPQQVVSLMLDGVEGLVSAGAIHGMWSLSRLAAADAELGEALTQGRYEEALALMRGGRCPVFCRSFEAYLKDWGFRSGKELMLTEPGLEEQPEVLLMMIARFMTLQGQDPAQVEREQATRRHEAMMRLEAQVSARGVMWRPWLLALKGARAGAQRAIGLRERARLKQALLYYRFRRVVLELGERWSSAGLLDAPARVFDLSVEEILDLGDGAMLYPEALRAVSAARFEARCEAQRAPRPPSRVTLTRGDYLGADLHSAAVAPVEGEGLQLRGAVASRGKVRGAARVAWSLAQGSALVPGEILVTQRTDPGWGPLFFIASGLILERGGLLSHGAILARELGVPAIVDVPGAMSALRDGQQVFLDADAGIVQIMWDEEAPC